MDEIVFFADLEIIAIQGNLGPRDEEHGNFQSDKELIRLFDGQGPRDVVDEVFPRANK